MMTARCILEMGCILMLLAGCAGEPDVISAPNSVSQQDYVPVYVQQIHECERDSNDLQYDLIYLDEDEIPELVVARPGYEVSVYTCHAGELYTVLDHWGYGAMGNPGYEYIPKQNVIRNDNADLAGAILYVWYGRVNEDHEIESCYEQPFSSWSFRDTNHNGWMDEDEMEESQRFYYWGDVELTQAEYDAYMIQGDYEWIEGRVTAQEILEELRDIGSANPESGQ